MTASDLTDAPLTAGPAFLALPDLASRALAGAVVHADDEFFAEKENLLLPGAPIFDPTLFGHKGKIYDGWETRRRRTPGEDSATVRLGVPGVVRGVVVDTAFFRGNYPPEVALDGAWVEGYPDAAELAAAPWRPLVPPSPAQGDALNTYEVADEAPVTHVRLRMIPDGGIARLRVHGLPTPDPRFLAGTVDLAAAENGGRIVDCSDLFYSSPANIIGPGRSRNMGEGWENARRRDNGNDHVTVALAGAGTVDHVEIDTSYYVGNAPGSASLRGIRSAEDLDRPEAWIELVPRTRLQPDCRHRYLVEPGAEPVQFVRVDVFPDGGIARLRVNGRLTAEALDALAARIPRA
ncbi:allantoicase [Rhodococcus sp. IEGM 1408]|uniref:allantoicase n=1 Tax=Rhodococcus sp. IEGM 1408 TaxID=3082220 RepID=UPI002955810B|nr:allantoicase [Rhodococcus sp. IEGM 1408]MDV8001480.1 allantoicase [Rhodococcus sp. IEGM 1408]